jgi:hypothetical protein
MKNNYVCNTKLIYFGPFANVKKYIVGHVNGNMQKTWIDKFIEARSDIKFDKINVSTTRIYVLCPFGKILKEPFNNRF